MKAITLHQPWATLVAHRAKTIETRSWRTHYRGPLAIHASQKVVMDGPAGYTSEYRHGQYRLTGPGWRVPLGAVVAVCELVDCVPMLLSPPEDPDAPHVLLSESLRLHRRPVEGDGALVTFLGGERDSLVEESL